jgi:hypothetical protein
MALRAKRRRACREGEDASTVATANGSSSSTSPAISRDRKRAVSPVHKPEPEARAALGCAEKRDPLSPNLLRHNELVSTV